MTDYPDGLDLEDEGSWWARAWKWLRGTFLLNWALGWRTLDEENPERCCSGHLRRLTIENDGDINIYLTPDPECSNLMNEDNTEGLVCEIPLSERNNFDVNLLRRLRVCIRIRICGRWVLDRAHGHNELHPVSTIQIL